MKERGMWKRYLFSIKMWMVCLGIFFLGGVVLENRAWAGQEAAGQEPCTLSLALSGDQGNMSGVVFQLYQIGRMSEQGELVLTGDFQSYPVTVDHLDSSGWDSLAQTLAAYAARDNLEPIQAGQTDENGKLVFDRLPRGLYLAVGHERIQGNRVCSPKDFVIALPGMENGRECFQVEAQVKCSFSHRSGDGGGADGGEDWVTRKVIKVWEDQGREEERPKEIWIQLLENGRVRDQVSLSQANGWSFTWNGLDGDSEWQVAEYEPPEGYTVSVSRQGITFVVTNTVQTERIQPELVPASPARPPAQVRLPQTGQPWWPVSCMAGIGLLLLLLGWFLFRRQENRES